MADYRRIEARLSDSRKFFSSPLWLRWAPGFSCPVLQLPVVLTPGYSNQAV